jgi:hypothetical protein
MIKILNSLAEIQEENRNLFIEILIFFQVSNFGELGNEL